MMSSHKNRDQLIRKKIKIKMDGNDSDFGLDESVALEEGQADMFY